MWYCSKLTDSLAYHRRGERQLQHSHSSIVERERVVQRQRERRVKHSHSSTVEAESVMQETGKETVTALTF